MSLVVQSVGNITEPEQLLNINKDAAATNGILRIGLNLAKRYVEGKWNLSMIGTCESYLSILTWCYYACVSRKLCLPIENIDPDYKRALWDITRKEIDPETKIKSRLIQLTKAQYALTEMSKLVYKNYFI